MDDPLLMFFAKNPAQNSATRKICETTEFRTAHNISTEKIVDHLKKLLKFFQKRAIFVEIMKESYFLRNLKF